MSVTHVKMVKPHEDQIYTNRIQASPQWQEFQDTIDRQIRFGTSDIWQEQERFENELARRDAMARRETPAPVVQAQVPLQVAPVMDPPPEPELSGKDMRSKRRQAKKNIEKGKKIQRNVTAYTVPILASESKRAEEQRTPYTPVPDENVFARVSSLSFNAYEFTPEFVGEHFEAVFGKYSDMARFDEMYSNKESAAYQALDDAQKVRADVLLIIFTKMHDAFVSALHSNGLKLNEDGGVSPDPNANIEADRAENEIKVRILKDEILDSAQTAERVLNKKVDDMFTPPPITDGMITMQRNMADTVDMNLGCRSVESYRMVGDLQTYIETMRSRLTGDDADDRADTADRILVNYVSIVQKADLLAARYAAGSERLQDADDSSLVVKRARQQAEEMRTQYDLLSRRREMMEHCVQHLLEGKEVSDAEAIFLKEKYQYDGAFAQKQQRDFDSATCYKRIYSSRRAAYEKAVGSVFPDEDSAHYLDGTRGRMMMLMKVAESDADEEKQAEATEHNEAIVILAKEIDMLEEGRKAHPRDPGAYSQIEDTVGRDLSELLPPLLDKIMNFDTRRLNGASDEELLAMQEEIIDLNLAGQMVTDLAKYNVSSEDRVSIRDRYLGKPRELPEGATPEQKAAYDEAIVQFHRKSAIFGAKCTLIQGAMMQARSVAVLHAQKTVQLKPEDIFSAGEMNKVGSQLQGDTPQEQCRNYFVKYYGMGQTQMDGGLTRLMNGSDIKQYVLAHQSTEREAAHEEIVGRLDDLNEYIETELSNLRKTDPKASVEDAVKALIDRRNEVLPVLTAELNSGDISDEEARELRAEIERIQLELTEIRFIQPLTRNYFTLAGSEKPLISESIFRSYRSYEESDAARMLTEDEYKKMLEQLAADAFLPENATDEQVKGAREEQQRGLRTYFETLKVNYNRMEELFGIGAEQDLVFLMEHLEEIDSLGGNIQVDYGLLKGDNGVLDMTDPGDVRLFHQVAYFGGLSTGMKALRGMIGSAAQMGDSGDMQVTMEILHAALLVGEDSRQYLMKNPLVPAPLEQKQGAA